MSDFKILALDMELSPNIADVWGLWNNNVSLSQLRESQQIICFGAKWVGKKRFYFRSIHHDDKKTMLDELWKLVDEADAILGWNSRGYDMKHARREWIENGYPPPSPVKHIDLMLTARSQMKFPSNKLDYVAQRLIGEGKVHHEGHELWVKCMAGDDKAWAKMKQYQKQDVFMLEPLYEKFKAWIPNHPNVGLYGNSDSPVCPACGSTNLQSRGFARQEAGVYRRYQCQEEGCGKWSRSVKRENTTDLRGI